jgi:adenosine deaminase
MAAHRGTPPRRSQGVPYDAVVIHQLPKLELHLHLGGTIEPGLAVVFARRHGLDPGTLGLTDGRYPSRYRDLDEFLDLYGRVDGLVRTAADVFEVAAAIARTQADQGIAWTEVITPIWPYLARGIDGEDLWDALAAGLAAGRPTSRFGVLLETFPDAVPGTPLVAEAVNEGGRRGLPVVGVGLMGVGAAEHRSRLAANAAEWRAAGLGLQVHAGETGPPGNVVSALDDLGADRIAHGITIVRDAAVLERIVRDRVPLDLCPSSNVAIAGVPSLEAHPIVELWRAGATVTVSTDDPPFVGATLSDEIDRVTGLLGLEPRDLVELQRRTLAVSFAPDDVRALVAAQLDAWAASLPS